MSEENTDESPDTESVAESVESSVTANLTERLKEKEPSEAEKEELLDEHSHHLIRKTTSKLTFSPDVGEGVEAEATAEIPDAYCFTCDEWIGLSGVELRGTPRSKTDAYWRCGPPTDVIEAKDRVRQSIGELAEDVYRTVETVETADDAFAFIADELERVRSTTDSTSGDNPQ